MSQDALTKKESPIISPETDKIKSSRISKNSSNEEEAKSNHERILQKMEDLDLLNETQVIIYIFFRIYFRKVELFTR